MNASATLKQLFAPFDADDVAFRAGYKAGNGFRVFLYLDKRSIRDRLDEALGPFNWTAHYEPLGEGFICALKIRVGDEWHCKEGVGGPAPAMDTEQNKVKSAATDAFRNAAAAWGFGKHLDNIPTIIWPGETNQKGQWRRWTDEGKLRKRIADLLQQQLAKSSRHSVIDESGAGKLTSETGKQAGTSSATTTKKQEQPNNVLPIENRPLTDDQMARIAQAIVAANGVSRVADDYQVQVNPKTTFTVSKAADGSATCNCERYKPGVRCQHLRAVALWTSQPAKPDSRSELKMLVTDLLDAGYEVEEIDSMVARVCDGISAIEELNAGQVAKALRSLSQKLDERKLKARASA